MARRKHGGQDSRRYYDWLDKAQDDMLAAQLLLGDDRLCNPCAFHCHQAIEKALKSYLLLRIKRPLDGHNLTWLCKQATNQDRVFSQWIPESTTLNRYYIETRYPTDYPSEVSSEEVHKAFRMACELYEFICNQVDEELDRRQAAAAEKGPKEHVNKYADSKNTDQ